jgi:hypothetical protein
MGCYLSEELIRPPGRNERKHGLREVDRNIGEVSSLVQRRAA